MALSAQVAKTIQKRPWFNKKCLFEQSSIGGLKRADPLFRVFCRCRSLLDHEDLVSNRIVFNSIHERVDQ